MAGMKNIWIHSLRVMSYVKAFAVRDGFPAGRTKTTNNIDPYDTHMDQKVKRFETQQRMFVCLFLFIVLEFGMDVCFT